MRKHKLNLRLPDGSLDPLSVPRILAVMAHPHDRKARYRFRHLKNKPNEKTARTAMSAFSKVAIRGRIAGDALLTLLQQHEGGGRASLEGAHDHVRRAFFHDSGMGSRGLSGLDDVEWNRAREKLGDARLSRRYFNAAFDEFRPAAHLWAAFEAAVYCDRRDIYSLQNPEAIARLVEAARDLAERASRVPLKRSPPEFVLPRRMVWEIRLPPKLTLCGWRGWF